jgi:hypothetical protein
VNDNIEMQPDLQQPIPSSHFEGKWDCGMHADHETHAAAQYCIDGNKCVWCGDVHLGSCEKVIPRTYLPRYELIAALKADIANEKNLGKPVAASPAKEWLKERYHWHDDNMRFPIASGDHYLSLYEVMEAYAAHKSLSGEAIDQACRGNSGEGLGGRGASGIQASDNA